MIRVCLVILPTVGLTRSREPRFEKKKRHPMRLFQFLVAARLATRLAAELAQSGLAATDAAPAADGVDPYLLLGVELAARYNSPACQRAISEMNAPMLVSMTSEGRGEGSTFKSALGEVFVLPRPVPMPPLLRRTSTAKAGRALYGRNQKVASSMFQMEGASYAGCNAVQYYSRRTWLPLLGANEGSCGRDHCEELKVQPGDVAFTFVREPIEVFIAAWLEVIHRASIHNRNPLPNSTTNIGDSLSRGWRSETNGTRLFQKNIFDIDHGKSLTFEAFHMWPQALKIASLPKSLNYSFIGRTETFVPSIKALFPGGKLPPRGHKAASMKDKVKLKRHFKPGPDEIRWMCSFLMVDFVCFDYPLPRECRNDTDETAQRGNPIRHAIRAQNLLRPTNVPARRQMR